MWDTRGVEVGQQNGTSLLSLSLVQPQGGGASFDGSGQGCAELKGLPAGTFRDSTAYVCGEIPHCKGQNSGVQQDLPKAEMKLSPSVQPQGGGLVLMGRAKDVQN